MIRILRSKAVRALAVLAVALTTGLGTQAAWASTSQVCGNGGSGYCLNDWGGAGASGDAINMYYGGTRNDDFYVQEVNRCSGQYTVQSTAYGDSTNCPFADTTFDQLYWNDDIVQIVDANSNTECVGTNSNSGAVLGSCADPSSGSGGADGVIQIIEYTACYDGYDGYAFLNRYWTDATDSTGFLGSGNSVGANAYYEGITGSNEPITCWGGFQTYAP
jgi:hypothetical protein